MHQEKLSLILATFLLFFTLASECSAYPSDFIAPGHWQTLEKPSLIGSHEILIIANNLNEEAMSGEKILLYRLGSHAVINEAATHASFEEVLITAGELAWLNQDADQSIQTILEVGSYVDRAPNIPHGPFRAGPDGCQMFVRYHY